jgi:peptidoglycan/xylan/chitin deacetylase (PgdA/CDA1 family)/2-polyprenyl-3-methyl-5-hydroxy-6-metoxy-1,4-benzoquinol methylase
VRLAEGLPRDEEERAGAVHDAVGWAVLLQELWGEPERALGWFYAGDGAAAAPASPQPTARFEIAAPLADLPSGAPVASVELRLGGAPLALVHVPVTGGVVPSAVLRARATAAGGYELARVAVREGIIGRPLGDPAPLRTRLAEAAAHADGGGLPPWAAALAGDGGTLVLGRHDGAVGTAASRRAMLPALAADALRDAASAAGEVAVGIGEPTRRVAYVPELLRLGASATPGARASAASRTASANAAERERAERERMEGFDRHYFETLFASTPDPWSYATPYEQLKYEQTLALLESSGVVGRVLELACAEGMFTERLAALAREVLATDVSQIAVDRTAARCAHLSNVRVARLDIVRDPVPRGFDAIVCSEVLYYLGGREVVAELARKLAGALAPGARIVMANCNVVVDDPNEPGLDWDVLIGAKGIGEVFAATPGLRLVRELRTPRYRIHLFERVGALATLRGRLFRRDARHEPEDAPWIPSAPHVEERLLMQGGQPRRGHLPSASTWELPILMYHSVAPNGSAARARYRVTPEAFEAQLQYLRDAGFRSATLDEWRETKPQGKPLLGRAVVLTFDDGFRDFAEHAWPLLRRYGFGGLVFLATDHVGGTNAWSRVYSEPAPLLDWDEVRRLRAEGAEFGSHTATHPFLTALSPAEVAREAARSRATLQRELGEPVTALAYPYGAEDAVVQHLAGAVGYTYGLSCRPGRSRLGDPLLALPRIEVGRRDTLHDFIAKLDQ